MRQRRKRLNPFRIVILLVLIAAGVYFNQVVVPTVPPLFIPTPTPTRSPESFVTDAEALVNEGKFVQAIEAYQQAIEVAPTNAANFVAAARLQIYLGLYDDALDNLGNALLINENNMQAHALRGWALGFKGDYLLGIDELKRAIELDPNNAIPYAYLAEVYGLQYQENNVNTIALEDAISNSQKAEQLSPNILETHRARGFILEITGNYVEALQQYQKAANINPNIADLHMALGRIYRLDEIGEYSQAVREFTQANLLNPTDPLPDLYLASVNESLGEYATAIQYAEQAIKDDPTDPYLYGKLGTLYYRNGDYPRTIDTFRLVIRGGTTEDGVTVEPLPLDYGTVSTYFSLYGLALARSGQCGEALQISQAMQDGVAADETAVYNALEMVNICQQVAENGTPVVTEEATP